MNKTLFLIVILFTSFRNLKTEQIKFSDLMEGDIIFHESNSEQAKAIKAATKSKYTHVGIIFKYGNDYRVLEAVEPVRITPLASFIKRGQKNHYVIKRLKDRETVLTESKIQDMKKYGNSLLGRHYDIYFDWQDDRIYCTELIWKLYDKFTGKKLGDLKTLKDFDLSSSKVQYLMKKRYGNIIPYSEPVISPVDMFNSTELITIISYN
ncbi:YiiX family permuted papain-like enzyme [Leptospira selangorensis]|uniref:YiiX family permuted papain-like enzyme n=1 Tax=Leptospira selangorensis TaxID=2484982 RepID=UPI0010842FA9|nr:YiiX family permuted papain-like enzyme [Leptospira selangorensis]TGK10679.1 YiiX family permuted papain-like enzyme [Leptospira selangorensis]